MILILYGVQMKNEEIRWKQRFENFRKSLGFLENAINIEEPDLTQKAGLIQFFEITFELSWNLMKDYLEEKGFADLRSPRDSIKTAFETELIKDGHTWLIALKNRNLTSHTYDEQLADIIVSEIKGSYYPLLKDLHDKLTPEL